MNAEWVRAFCLELPHVVETMQWGANLVFWVGDKAVGGKMFCLVNLDADGRAAIVYPVGAERYGELVELEGVGPAPYLARVYWVAVDRWDVFRRAEWERELTAAHALKLAKLPKKTRNLLEMPPGELKRLVAERRKTLAVGKKGVTPR